MKKSSILLLGYAFIGTFASANSIQKVLPLTTTIDINNLYIDAITGVEFDPAMLELTLNDDSTGFEATSTTMKITTDIPTNDTANPYTSTMTQNTASCTNFGEEEFPQSGFVTVRFDGVEVALDEAVDIDDFNNPSDGDHKSSEHNVVLFFSPFSTIVMDGSPKQCSGEIEFTIGIAI